MRRLYSLGICSLMSLAIAGCSGGSSAGGGNPPPPPPPSSVTITPSSAKINEGGTQTFSATVNGTTEQSVFWEIEEAVPHSGDSTHGFISTSGVYVAPTTLTSVTIKALAAADPTKSGTAAVTVQAGSATSVSISPGSGQVQTFGSIQFSATVTGNANTAVVWKVNGATGGGPLTGAVSTAGLFTAPNSVPVQTTGNNSGQTEQVVVTAVSQADSTAMDSVLMTIVPPQQHAQGANSPLGVSGGNAKATSTVGGVTSCCGGTLGAVVSRGGNLYVLSNNHVLADSDTGTTGAVGVGDPITQPGLIDNNCAVPPTVATLSQFYNLESGAAPKIDAALALINPGGVDATGTILQLGSTNLNNQPTNGPPHAGSGIAPTLSTAVAKSGRSTGLTCSSIVATNVASSVEYQKGCGTGSTFNVSFTNQVDIANSGFSAEGDSGSLVVTQANADPVALLFAGNASDTLANPISDVLNGLADPSTHAVPVVVGSSTAHQVAACSLPGPQSATGLRLAVLRPVASAETLQNALIVRDSHAPDLMALPEVQAVGVGASYDNPADPAILFFVTRGQPHADIPPQVEGIRTRVLEGDFFAQRGALSAEESAALEQTLPKPEIVYPIPDAEIARAKLVHAAHANELMQRPGVQGVGISSSMDSPGEAALMIFLIRGVAHNPIPAVIDGLRTRVRESGRFRAGWRGGRPPTGCTLPPAARRPLLAQPATSIQ